MYVCVCQSVTDRQIKESLTAGALGFHALQTQLGVATQCGSCTCMVEDLVEQHQLEQLTASFAQCCQFKRPTSDSR